MDSQPTLEPHSHSHGGQGSSTITGLGGGLNGIGGSNKRPYEGSSSESVVSFATDSVSVTQNSVISGSVANSVVGPDGKRSVKSVSIGCRQRVTVVCAECKRLKLKCDRRTPCGSCTKRDTVEKCIYSQAAAEKVDVQSLNIRLQAVEGKLSGMNFLSDPTSSSSAGPSNSRTQKKRHPSTSSLAPHLSGAGVAGTGHDASADASPQNRAFLAIGAHGASVAVNLEGIAGLWVDHLGLNKASSSTAGRESQPPSIAELDLERLGVRTVRLGGSGSGMDLRLSSYPSSPAEGLLSLIEEHTELFRVPASVVPSSETITGVGDEREREHDVEHGGEEGDDDLPTAASDSAIDRVGVSPRLVQVTFPSPQVRAEIFKRFEQHHFMAPSVNFMVFRNRIEEMCAWAEAELGKGHVAGGSENGRRDELLPTTSSSAMMGSNSAGPPPHATMVSNGVATGATTIIASAGPLPPTLSFFAAACFGIALGARCWMIEQEMLGPKPSAPDRACSPSSNSGGNTNAIYDPSMPPPPLPLAPFDTHGSASPASPASHHDTSTNLTPYLDPSLPTKLYRLGKFALNLAMECAGYEVFDTDYIHARCLQARYLLGSHHGLGEGADLLRDLPGDQKQRKKIDKRKRKTQVQPNGHDDTIMDDAFAESPSHPNSNTSRRKGKEKAPPSSSSLPSSTPPSPSRGPALALAPEMFGVVSDAIANARMMGMNHDPELVTGGKFSVYEAEMRRRMWWELAIQDAFVADCLGESPFINDDRVTTELPTDVDEESFGPDSANRPAPNIESMHGNIDGFIQRCRLVVLAKKLARKVGAFRELHPDASAAETREMLVAIKAEITDWLDTMPEHLKLREIPTNVHSAKTSAAASPSSKKSPSSPAEKDNREGGATEDFPHIIAHRCRLAISARHTFLQFCLALTKDSNSKPEDHSPDKAFDALMMLEPAIYIVRAWRYLHAVYRNEHPALFMCYALTRELFNTAVVLGHLAIKHPLYAPRAVVSLRLASETLRDPSVLTSKRSADDKGDKQPSEAVRILEELIKKAEAAEESTSAEFGDLGPTSTMGKRKHEEVEIASSDLMYHFRFPFVGPSVVSAGPPVAAPPLAALQMPTMPGVSMPMTNGVSVSMNNTISMRVGEAGMRNGASAGDPRPATSKLKSSHPQIGVRSRRKDSSRARANSTASQRSDVSHMLHPSSNLSSSTPHGHGVPPPNRLPSAEPSTPLLGPTSYPGPLSTTPGPGQSHYNSPPGTSGGAGGSSSQPPPPPSSNGNDYSSGFRDTGNFHSTSPASYGSSFPPPQSGPSLPVPSQVGFDGYGMDTASTGQRRDSMSLGSGETSSFGYSSANGIERPGPVGMHQPSGFDSIGGLPRQPSEPPQDRPFTRTLVDSRTSHTRDTDERMGPPPPPSMPPLEHPQHSHSHPPPHLHPPQTYHPHSHMQQGWSDYPQWPQYYPG